MDFLVYKVKTLLVEVLRISSMIMTIVMSF